MKLKSITPSAARDAFDFADAHHDRVVAAARVARLREPLRIGLGIDELERITDRQVGEQLAPRAAINCDREPLLDGQAANDSRTWDRR